MMPFSGDSMADITDDFNTISRYFDDIVNINNVHFDNMLSQIYPSELQLKKANTSDSEAVFWTCICPFQIILFLRKFR